MKVEIDIRVLTIIIILIIVFLLYLSSCKEDFTNNQEQLAASLITFLYTNPTYIEYLDFLNKNKNTSQNLVIKNNYNVFKDRLKMNLLDTKTILSAM
jgi:hypothetical protein